MAKLHESTAAACAAAAERSHRVAGVLGGVQHARGEWEALTADTRRVAVAADTELRRRGLLADADQLASAEPEAFSYEGDTEPDEDQVRKTLGLDAETVTGSVPERVSEVSLIASHAQGRIDELRTMVEPDHAGDDELAPSEAWPKLVGRERQSVLQPAEPPLPPSPRVLEAVAERDREAAGSGSYKARPNVGIDTSKTLPRLGKLAGDNPTVIRRCGQDWPLFMIADLRSTSARRGRASAAPAGRHSPGGPSPEAPLPCQQSPLPKAR